MESQTIAPLPYKILKMANFTQRELRGSDQQLKNLRKPHRLVVYHETKAAASVLTKERDSAAPYWTSMVQDFWWKPVISMD